jgi:DNA-binding NtrC family response regulator
MVVGEPAATAAVLRALEPHLATPVSQCSAETGLSLPQRPAGTVVVEELAALDLDQQRRLLRWLNEADERVQIVSMTSQPLYAFVEQGTFLAELYYRLNTVRIDLKGERML